MILSFSKHIMPVKPKLTEAGHSCLSNVREVVVASEIFWPLRTPTKHQDICHSRTDANGLHAMVKSRPIAGRLDLRRKNKKKHAI